MINIPTKFEMPIFVRYGNMKGAANVENGVVRGHSRSLRIAPFDRAHTSSY